MNFHSSHCLAVSVKIALRQNHLHQKHLCQVPEQRSVPKAHFSANLLNVNNSNCNFIAEPKGEASNRDALSSPVCICMHVYMYICPSQPEMPRLRNSPVFSAGAHDNKTLYLAIIGHETAQHSTSLLLTSPIASARATCLLAILPYWLTSFAPRGQELSLFPRVK